jgi:hypothetical protein
MKPGRELDALIAEKVMGYSDVKVGFIDGINWDKGFPPGKKIAHAISHYSTDISAAWEVVDKLLDKWSFDLSSISGKYFRVILTGGGNESHLKRLVVETETATHAICLAALKAMEFILELI